jgi:D-lactate dehydrogenase (cytochrome)
MFNRVTAADLADLRSVLADDRVSTGESVLNLHSADQTCHKGHPPEVVVFPVSTEDVAAILKLADGRRIPVTAWGAGTSLEGNCVPVEGGIVVDFQLMNKILEIRPKDFQVDVQAGVTYKDMNKTLAREGLFFPPDPGANATIGGMVATNASGIRTIKFGATRDNVMRLKAVLAGGLVVHAGTCAHKNSAGYDLVRLLVGSEGTLALVTEATLKLRGIPEDYSAAVAAFETVRDAADAVVDIMGSGLGPAALELLDADAIGYLNRDGKVALDEKPMLFIEFSGSNPTGLASDLEQAGEICRGRGCLRFQSGVGRSERNRLWEVRHGFGESLIRANPGLDVLIMDTAVPLSKFADMVEFAVKTAAAFDLRSCISSHAGDGNLHLNIVGKMQDKAFATRLNQAYEKIVSHAIFQGGTATGEHGVGIGKRKFMRQQHGAGVDIMRGIKHLFDPNGILNPCKVLPAEDAS